MKSGSGEGRKHSLLQGVVQYDLCLELEIGVLGFWRGVGFLGWHGISSAFAPLADSWDVLLCMRISGAVAWALRHGNLVCLFRTF